MSIATSPRQMTATELHEHLQQAWRDDRRPGEVARETGMALSDITAFYGARYRGAKGARGARAIVRSHVALRAEGRR